MPTDYTDTQLEMLNRRWRQDASPHLSLQLADVYRQRGELDQALPILEQGLEAHPGHMSVQVALGRYRLEAGDPEGATAVLRQVVDRDAGHLVANKLLVRAHLAMGDRKSAGDRLELYALLNDNDPELETLRAMVEGAAPSTAAGSRVKTLPEAFARPAAGRPADLASVDPPRRRALKGGRGEPFADFGVRPPGATADLRLFPVLAAAAGRSREASAPPATVGAESEPQAPPVETPVARPVVERQDAAAGATATLGALYLAQGHLKDARETFERVLERDPDDAEARAGLAETEHRLAGDGAAEPKTPAAEPPSAPAETAQPPAPRAPAGTEATIAHLQGYLSRIRKAAERLSA